MRYFITLILITISICANAQFGNYVNEKRAKIDREVHTIIQNKEYLDWYEFSVERIMLEKEGAMFGYINWGDYPKPESFSGNKDMTYKEEYPIIIGERISSMGKPQYRINDVYGNPTKYRIEIDYPYSPNNIVDKPAVIVFTSGSVRKPSGFNSSAPPFYTTQFYKIYIM